MLIHKGKEFEEKLAKDCSLPDPNSTTNPEFKCVLQTIKDSIGVDPKKWSKMALVVRGLSEETTTQICIGEAVEVMAAKSKYAIDMPCDALINVCEDMFEKGVAPLVAIEGRELCNGPEKKGIRVLSADKLIGYRMHKDDFYTAVKKLQMLQAALCSSLVTMVVKHKKVKKVKNVCNGPEKTSIRSLSADKQLNFDNTPGGYLL